MKTKKLYELPRGARFRLIGDVRVPPAADVPTPNDEFRLETIDGMYSRVFSPSGQLYHLAAFTEVEPVFIPAPAAQ